MNKTLNINLAGFIFHMDEEAFFRLEKYLNTLKKQFANTEGGKEIISDIETRIAELFKEKTGQTKEVVSLEDVDYVISIMGKPEDYLDPDADTATNASDSYEAPFQLKAKRIFRDPDNKILGGVASGLAAYFNVDSLWIRLAFVLLFFFSGFGLIFYGIMWLVIPKAQTTAEKLQMRGEHVNISNIEKSIKEELGNVNQNMKEFGSRMSNINTSKATSHLGTFFSDLGNFILDALRLILKVIGKLFGLFFLFVGFAILIAIGAGLFAGGINILGADYNYSDLLSFLEIVTITSGHYNLLLVGIVLSVIAPFFLLVYFGIRLLFNLEPLNRPARSALAFTTFLGLVFLLISGIRMGLEFDSHSEVSKEIPLTTGKEIVLQLPNDSLAAMYKNAYASSWVQSGDKNAFNDVEIGIYRTEGDQAFIKIITEAQGQDRKQARYNARETSYEVQIIDSIIIIPNYYILHKGQKYRGQEISVRLYLPEGYSVYFNQEVGELIEHAQNVQDRWEYEMINTWWIMTENGLNCLGCELPKSYEAEETDSLTFDNGTLKLKIDEGGIELNIDEGKKDGEKVEMRLTQRVYDNASYYVRHLLPFKNESYVMI